MKQSVDIINRIEALEKKIDNLETIVKSIIGETSSDIIQFYAFSKDTMPGNGVGDIINDPPIYSNLKSYPNWRRMFSSFWSDDPFVYEGKTYLSYEHAYQASKFILNNLKFGYKFTIESGHDYSKLLGIDVQRAGRIKKLSTNQINVWNKAVQEIKTKIYRAKFTLTTNPGLVLLATQNAELVNAGPRIKKIRCTRMELLRQELRQTINLIK